MPFWEFVHLHIHFFSVYSLSIRFAGKPPSFSLPLPAVFVLFVRISGRRDHFAPVLSRRHRIPVPVPGSPRYSAAVLRCRRSERYLPYACNLRTYRCLPYPSFPAHSGCCPGRSGCRFARRKLSMHTSGSESVPRMLFDRRK